MWTAGATAAVVDVIEAVAAPRCGGILLVLPEEVTVDVPVVEAEDPKFEHCERVRSEENCSVCFGSMLGGEASRLPEAAWADDCSEPTSPGPVELCSEEDWMEREDRLMPLNLYRLGMLCPGGSCPS